MYNKSNFVCCAVIFLLSLTTTFAQNNTNSPYTRFGYGELVDVGLTKHKSMGGVAFGSRSSLGINPANPAAYTSIDSLTFLFEFGAGGRISHFSQAGGLQKTAFTGNIDYIALAFPITRWMAASVGLLPLSFSGYNFAMQDTVWMRNISQTGYLHRQSFTGAGGFNQVYLGLSAKFLKHIAIGVNVSYMFGNLNNTQTVTYDTISHTISPLPLPLSSSRISTLSANSIKLRYGLQAFHTFKNAHTLTVGGIFEMKSNLRGTHQIIRQTYDASNRITDADTITNPDKKGCEIPMIYGVGATYSYKNRLTIGADFQQQFWNDVKYFGVKDTLRNRMKIAIGGEYRHNPLSKNFLERMVFRLGANYATPYIHKSGNVGDINVSLGVGIPFRSNRSFLNIGFEYGKMGSSAKNLIREDYFKISIGASLNEFWFFKRRFE